MRRLLVILVLVPAAWGQSFKRTGTSGFVFLEVPVSARYAALGESGLAGHETGALSLFLNPASAAFGEHVHAFGASYAPWLADISHYAVSYAYRSDIGLIGISAVVLDHGSMTRTVRALGTREFEALGTFSARSSALGLSFGRRLTDRFAFGLTLKYVEERIDVYAASNVLLDGGILFDTGFRTLRIAAVVQNFGTETAFRNDVFAMPSMLRLGAAMDILGSTAEALRVTASVETLHPGDNDERVQVGIETAWDETLMLRYGYKFNYDEEDHSFGVGLRSNMGVVVTTDFAYVMYGRLGDVLRFSIHMGL